MSHLIEGFHGQGRDELRGGGGKVMNLVLAQVQFFPKLKLSSQILFLRFFPTVLTKYKIFITILFSYYNIIQLSHEYLPPKDLYFP